MDENTCKFVRTKSATEGLNIVNFVYEKEALFPQKFMLSATYLLHLVTNGCGALHTPYGVFPLSEGQLFLTFPAKPYFIENTDSLNYIYISFIGTRAPGLIERLKIPGNHPVLDGFSDLKPMWKDAILRASDNNIDLICEGLLLYTFSFLCACEQENPRKEKLDGILKVKQYMDAHYTDTTLNLETVSRRFNYSPKYVSDAFSKMVRINFSRYLNDLRVRHAKTLLESGMISVTEIALESGYKDPLYFSKLFKARYGVSPKQFLKETKQELCIK